MVDALNHTHHYNKIENFIWSAPDRLDTMVEVTERGKFEPNRETGLVDCDLRPASGWNRPGILEEPPTAEVDGETYTFDEIRTSGQDNRRVHLYENDDHVVFFDFQGPRLPDRFKRVLLSAKQSLAAIRGESDE